MKAATNATAKRREPRRHTLQSGIDQNMVNALMLRTSWGQNHQRKLNNVTVLPQLATVLTAAIGSILMMACACEM